jgi:hypothetical protein
VHQKRAKTETTEPLDFLIVLDVKIIVVTMVGTGVMKEEEMEMAIGEVDVRSNLLGMIVCDLAVTETLTNRTIGVEVALLAVAVVIMTIVIHVMKEMDQLLDVQMQRRLGIVELPSNRRLSSVKVVRRAKMALDVQTHHRLGIVELPSNRRLSSVKVVGHEKTALVVQMQRRPGVAEQPSSRPWNLNREPTTVEAGSAVPLVSLSLNRRLNSVVAHLRRERRSLVGLVDRNQHHKQKVNVQHIWDN